MDQFGELFLSSSVGYNGTPVYYTDTDAICYVNSNCLKVINISSGSTKYLNAPGDGITALAVNQSYGYLAFADDGLHAQIYVYSTQNLNSAVATLKADINSLGYVCLSFANNGSILVSCSNIPEVTLTIWNWATEENLCYVDLNAPPLSLTFNPLNWRQFCCSTENGFTVWNIRQVNEKYDLQRRDIILPFEDGSFGLEFVNEAPSGSRPTTGHGGLHLTKASMAGLVGTGKENVDPSNLLLRCVAICHCWASANQIYVGCSGNKLLCADIETGYVTVLCNYYDDDLEKDDPYLHFDCMQLHSDGLFVGGKDGILRCLKIKDKQVSTKLEVNIGRQISSLHFSSDYQSLVIGSSEGTICTYSLNNSSVTNMSEDFVGKVIGIACLPGNQHIVTCKSTGLLQVWTVKDMHCIGSLHLNYDISCIASPCTSSTVFLGTKAGSIVVIDAQKSNELRCVCEQFLYKTALTKLCFDNTGSVLITSSSDPKIFLLNARLSTQLEVLGHTDVPGSVLCSSCLHISQADIYKVLVGVSASDHQPGCNQLILFEITSDLIKKKSSLYMDSTRLLKDVSISKQTYLLKAFTYDICIISNDVAFGVVHQGKKIAKFVFNEYEDSQTNLVLEPTYTYEGHGVNGGCISSSCHFKWLVSASPDGYLIARAVGAMNNIVKIQAGNYRAGGLSHACFSSDAQMILTVGNDGCISSWSWNFSSLGRSKAAGAIETYLSNTAMVKSIKNTEDEILSKLPEITLKPEKIGSSTTWLEEAVDKAHKKEDEKYAEVKNSLRNEINDLRNQVLELIRTNEEVPDIEKLDRYEFNMDVEERQSMVAEMESHFKKLRSEIELQDAATQYTRHLIKTECWDNMKTKGKSLKSFATNIEVCNYPMRERSQSELEELDMVVCQRKIEKIQSELRDSVLPDGFGSFSSIVEKREIDYDEELTEVDKYLRKESVATYGSLGFLYGGYNDLLQTQFELHTKNQKRNQIVLLKDCIIRIKEAFNETFEEVYNAKIQEIRKINERNTRIKKILRDMHLQEELIDAHLDHSEQPEMLLVVNEEEILVEKYISEEEQKRLDELARLEEERRLAEMADNARGRALEMMMAGRLETNLEDELKQEIERPEFMNVKPDNEWNEEEQKLAKEYEIKTTQLHEDREKYRKSLETELRKLQTTNVEATTNFDERLNQLFQRRTKTEMVILQEELKIVRLNASILFEEELEARELELFNFLEIKKEEKQLSSLAVGDAKRDVEAFRDMYETLIADDRTLDKMFRKEFLDLDSFTVDVLYKLFKKRPRAQRTLKAATESHKDAFSAESKTRPSSSRAASAAAHNLEKAMQELDSEHHMPEHMDVEVWKRMVMLRRNKVEREQQLKAKALVLADMNDYLQHQIDRDEDLKMTIEKTFEDIQRLREERVRFNMNLEVQLLLKQGQVEVGSCDFVPSYTDSVLIHRSAVEDLNSTIKTLGEMKLASMRESKDFRKGIHQLAWELKEMFMRAEDYQTTAHDLQMLRVTKELQVYLGETDRRQSKQQEIATLERTLDMCNKMHGRNVQDRKRIIRKLRHQIVSKVEENEQLDIDLEKMALSVAERKNIHDVTADNRSDNGASKRMQDIITRRKLVDLAKAQASEISMLRAEVERLRMRTFPALVQLDPR
ncbi:cilia- and flagella-associated protein 43-like [Hydractinia symbiolongicarpus]|uniref:cilia- and flagella-associated protein 43-like n=1 Tax=Hydractinia symbiolongicarpus TaxID=13093 RepID=UPI0025510B13|nr:cilia- and flagella-associated protein 43-like [Hydractinia symbiolongicarpus]